MKLTQQNKIDILENEKKKAECQIDSLRMHATKTDEQKLQLEKEVQLYKNQVFSFSFIYHVVCVYIRACLRSGTAKSRLRKEPSTTNKIFRTNGRNN
jgi:hypothetical protein